MPTAQDDIFGNKWLNASAHKYLTGIATGLLTVFVTEAIRKQRKARFAGEAI